MMPSAWELRKCLTILHNFTDEVIEQKREAKANERKRDKAVSDDNETLGIKKRLAFLGQVNYTKKH